MYFFAILAQVSVPEPWRDTLCVHQSAVTLHISIMLRWNFGDIRRMNQMCILKKSLKIPKG